MACTRDQLIREYTRDPGACQRRIAAIPEATERDAQMRILIEHLNQGHPALEETPPEPPPPPKKAKALSPEARAWMEEPSPRRPMPVRTIYWLQPPAAAPAAQDEASFAGLLDDVA